MTSERLAFLLAAVVCVVAGCGREPLPANQATAKNRAELEARFDRIAPGHSESEVAAYMGKPGAQVAGYSTSMLKRKPEGAISEFNANETDKYWASDDWAFAVRVVFDAGGKAKTIELLRLTPTGPAGR
jgi:hypothetical protein